MRKLKIFFLIVLFFGLLFVFRNFVIRQAVSLGARAVIGAPVRIKSLSVDIPRQKISAKGIEVYNPTGFVKKPFIEITKAKFEFNALPLLWGKIHIPLLYLDIHAVTLIKNTDGVTNIDSLKLVKQFEKADKKKREFKPLRMNIDALKLNIEQFIQINHRENNEPFIKVYEYPIRNGVFRDITSGEQLVLLIIAKAIGKATVQSVGIKVACAYLGVNSMPVSIAGLMLKKDNSVSEWPIEVSQAFEAGFDVIDQIGELVEVNRDEGIIKAKIYGAKITIRIEQEDEERVSIRVYARKYLLSRKEIAAGILYQIDERLERKTGLSQMGAGQR